MASVESGPRAARDSKALRLETYGQVTRFARLFRAMLKHWLRSTSLPNGSSAFRLNSIRAQYQSDANFSYSLMEVFDKILNWKFTNTEYTTGLPEYR